MSIDTTDTFDHLQDENAGFFIEDEAPLHKYFTMIPNIVFEMGLSPIEFTLYSQLRRVCGEKGRCWMKGDTLARLCGVGKASISRAKQELVQRGLLRVGKGSRLKHETDRIYLVNIWRKNLDFFENLELRSSPVELGGSLGELEYEEEPYTKKNNIAGAAQPALPEEKKVPPKLSPLNSKLFLEALRDDPQSSTEGSESGTKDTSLITTSLGETVPGDNKRYQRKKKPQKIGFTAPEPPKERPRDELWDALEALTKINVKLYGAARFAKELKPFRALGVTPEQVERFKGWWYLYDWRGQKNQPPTMQNIRECWKQAMLGVESKKPEQPAGVLAPPPTPKGQKSKTMLAMEARWKEMDDEERNSK